MRGDLVGDEALLDVVGVRQAEVLLRRDVAEHRRAVPADDRRADGARDVVVAGRDVGDERAERVERRLVADLLLAARRSSRAGRSGMWPGPSTMTCTSRSHARSVSSPSVSSSANCAASEASAIDPGRSPSPSEIDTSCSRQISRIVVEALVQRVLALVVDHPAREQPAAARDDAGHAVLAERQVLEPHAGVDRHVVDALARLRVDDLEQHARP